MCPLMNKLILPAFTLLLSLILPAYGQSSENSGADSSLNLHVGPDHSIIGSLVGDQAVLPEIYAEQDSDSEEGNIHLDVKASDLLPETQALKSQTTIRPKCGLPPSMNYQALQNSESVHQTLDKLGAELVDNCSLEATFDF